MDQIMEYITSAAVVGIAIVSIGAGLIAWTVTEGLEQFFRFMENNKE